MRGIVAITILTCAAGFGQTAEPKPSFEVASIKEAAPPAPGMGMRVGRTGGPGSRDPGRATWTNMSLRNLTMEAYNLRPYQLTGPEWLDSSRFEVTVKIPEGTTKEQFQLMLQNLLDERFKLKFHNETKEMPIYELVVAKNGPKLKEAEPPPAPNADGPPSGQPAPRPPGFKMGADGFPVLAPEQRQGMIMMNGKARSRSSNQTTAQIAGMLSGQVGKPVTDATGLTGKYDYELFWASDGGMRVAAPTSESGPVASAPEESGPDIFRAIQEQLGLKLEQKKGPVQVMVVDHLEKSPTEN